MSSHTHEAATGLPPGSKQCWPGAHGPPVPHRHWLPMHTLVRLLGAPLKQLAQMPASVSQAAAVLPATHRFVLGSQQPAHVAGLHRQEPPVQVSPSGHAPPSFAQMHLPLGSQVSVWVTLQAAQVEPAVPHFGQTAVVHAPEEQHSVPAHPVAQPEHTPASQLSGAQLRQGCPALPHATCVVPG